MLKNISYCITYRPVKDEIDPFAVPNISEHVFEDIYTLPTAAHSSPWDVARDAIQKAALRPTCILVPGTAFDRFGTRHGRGGGWFDRFLAAVPRDWLRIGLTDASHFTQKQLIRKPWDQPMDWIICKQGNSWKTIETRA